MSGYKDVVRKERDQFEQLYKEKVREVTRLREENEALKLRVRELNDELQQAEEAQEIR